MTTPADIALEFAKVVMGWDDAFILPATDPYTPKDYIVNTGWEKMFNYTDLNAVMEAVRGWCKENNRCFSLGYGPGQNGYGAFVGSSDTFDENPCIALMQAAIAAAGEGK